jgi:type II secretory pathway pseudopilin PulG
MIPMFLLNLVGGRKLVAWIIIGIIVAAVVGGVAWAGAKVKGWQTDSHELAVVKPQLKAYQDAQKVANDKVLVQAPKDEAERRKLAEDQAALAAEKLKVARAWERVNAVEETTDEAGNPVVRLSDGWGMCFAAAATGDPADVAACEAAGGDGAVEERPGG